VLGCVPSWGDEDLQWQTGGKILPVYGYRDEREDQYGLFSVLVLFGLVAPPLQPGVAGPCLVRVLASPAICR
jgi:hypothetical protein